MQLYINTYGTYVHVKDELFEIRIKKDGKVEKYHYSSKKVSGIIISIGAAISSDAVKLAVENNIDILFVGSNGYPYARMWHCKLGSTTKIRKEQLKISTNTIGMKLIKEWVSQKINNQTEFIKNLKKHRKSKADYLDEKIARLQNLEESIKKIKGNSLDDISDTIRGIEGTAARLYFETLSSVMPDEYKFNGRSSRPAKDLFNTFLNYAYGILYGKIEKSLMIAGLDPYVGILHRDDYNQMSFVFDFIEPYRIYADTVVFRLFSSKKVNKSHTDKITGGYYLNKSGKELLVTAFNNYFDNDTIRYKGRNQTRSNAIQMDAHSFANSLIK